VFPAESKQRASRKLQRRRYNGQGARYASHIDGGDKLKYYGFPYWMEVDGWSRKILSLNLVDSNNDPAIVARIWLNTVTNYGLPVVVMSDAGSENSLIHTFQMFLRRNHADPMAGLRSALTATSPQNQRSENMNRTVREQALDHFISDFETLEAAGYLVTINPIQMALLRLVYDDLVKAKFQELIHRHNNPRIRSTPQNPDTPAGKPDELFFSPEQYTRPDDKTPGVNYKIEPDEEDMAECFHFLDQYEQKRGAAPEVTYPSVLQLQEELYRQRAYT